MALVWDAQVYVSYCWHQRVQRLTQLKVLIAKRKEFNFYLPSHLQPTWFLVGVIIKSPSDAVKGSANCSDLFLTLNKIVINIVK